MANRELTEEWKELNKGWLKEFPFYEEETDDVWECWGYTGSCDDLWIVSNAEDNKLCCKLSDVNIDIEDLTVKSRRGVNVMIEDYFLNWKAPTEKEKQIYNMLTGLSVPWSTEHPFKFVGEE